MSLNLTSRLLYWTLLLPTLALAKVDDAKAAADTASETAIKEGFSKREEYWSGQAKSGAIKGVKAQLFKGNDYWFSLGCGQAEVEVSLEIFDLKGNKVSTQVVEITKGKAVRVTPPGTGSYIIKFSVINKKDASAAVDWALTYAYR
jgi:hypothetical protein